MFGIEHRDRSLEKGSGRVEYLRRHKAAIANNVGIDPVPVVDPLLMAGEPRLRHRMDSGIVECWNWIDVFWFELNIIFENQKLLLPIALYPERREDLLIIDDDVSRIFTESRNCRMAFNESPKIEASVGKNGEKL